MGSQVEIVEEGRIGGGEWLQRRLQERKSIDGADTRLSAYSARPPHIPHIWLYHGSSRRRSTSDDPVALPVVAQLNIGSVVFCLKLKIRRLVCVECPRSSDVATCVSYVRE